MSETADADLGAPVLKAENALTEGDLDSAEEALTEALGAVRKRKGGQDGDE